MQDFPTLETAEAAEETRALRAECESLQALVCSLLLKNQELRFALAQLRPQPDATLAGARNAA